MTSHHIFFINSVILVTRLFVHELPSIFTLYERYFHGAQSCVCSIKLCELVDFERMQFPCETRILSLGFVDSLRSDSGFSCICGDLKYGNAIGKPKTLLNRIDISSDGNETILMGVEAPPMKQQK